MPTIILDEFKARVVRQDNGVHWLEVWNGEDWVHSIVVDTMAVAALVHDISSLDDIPG